MAQIIEHCSIFAPSLASGYSFSRPPLFQMSASPTNIIFVNVALIVFAVIE